MNQSGLWAMSAAAVLALAGMSCKDQGTGPIPRNAQNVPQAPGAGLGGTEVTGKATSVRQGNVTLTTQDGRQATLHPGPYTRVVIQGRTVNDVTQIPEGSEVRATFTGREGDNQVLQIVVLQPGGAQGNQQQGSPPPQGAGGAAPRGSENR